MSSQVNQSDSYKQGYSDYTTATHERRTVESSAAFLLPHIKATDHILDVGCGPGTITRGFAKYARQGSVVGLDMSADVLAKARRLATEAEAEAAADGPGPVRFEQGDVLEGLPYADDTFDVVYCSQVLGHLPPSTGRPRRALAEMRRVLKPGGVLASRDGLPGVSAFHPRGLGLDRLWSRNLRRAVRGAPPADEDEDEDEDDTAASLPALYRSVGFDVDGGKVRIGAGTLLVADPDARRFFAWRAAGQLAPGDPFHASWRDAGVSADEIARTVAAVRAWAETEDAWFAALQCEMLAWK